MENLWLLMLLVVPLFGTIVCALLPSGRQARAWGLIVALATTAIAVVIAWNFDWRGGTETQWGFGDGNPLQLLSIKFAVRLGADSVSVWLVLLTVLLMPLAIAASFGSIRE